MAGRYKKLLSMLPYLSVKGSPVKKVALRHLLFSNLESPLKIYFLW